MPEETYRRLHQAELQKSWKERSLPHVHGWVYDLSNGLVQDVHAKLEGQKDLAQIYRFHNPSRDEPKV